MSQHDEALAGSNLAVRVLQGPILGTTLLQRHALHTKGGLLVSPEKHQAEICVFVLFIDEGARGLHLQENGHLQDPASPPQKV